MFSLGGRKQEGDQMKNLLPNLYTASTALVNQAISYSIYSKIKSNDAVNNNER